jgi:hypothetical protein
MRRYGSMQMVYARGTVRGFCFIVVVITRRAPAVDENDDNPVDKIGSDDEFIQFDMPKSMG